MTLQELKKKIVNAASFEEALNILSDAQWQCDEDEPPPESPSPEFIRAFVRQFTNHVVKVPGHESLYVNRHRFEMIEGGFDYGCILYTSQRSFKLNATAEVVLDAFKIALPEP